MKNFFSDKRGNIAVIAALGIPVFAGGLALGTEAGYWLVQKSQLSATTDAMSVSAVRMREKNVSVAKIEAVLKKSMIANGYPAATMVKVTYPDASSVTINATFPAQKYFSGAIFSGAVDISAKATIRSEAEVQPACLLALNPTESGALTFTGSSSVALGGCVAASNSTAGSGISLGGSTSVSADCLASAGGISNPNKSKLKCAAPLTGQSPMPDPYASVDRPASVGCSAMKDPEKKGATKISPGCFNGNTDLKTEIIFEPGVYVLENTSLKINAKANVSGTGVTFVLKGTSTLDFNGSATIDLKAPTSATSAYKDMLFIGDNSGARSHKINGGAGTSMTGAIYLPQDDIKFSGNSGAQSTCLKLVADTIEFTGNTDFKSNCVSSVPTTPSSAQAKLRIVE
jgi:hypothetical protein